MAAGFWKKNERVIMVVFLVLLAPLFAFPLGTLTGSSVANSDEVMFFFDGEPVDVQEFRLARKDFSDLQQYVISSRVGALVQIDPTTNKLTRKPLPFGASEEQVRFFLAQEREAIRLGIEPSKEQIQDEIIALAKPMLAHYRVHTEFPEFVVNSPQYIEQFQLMLEQPFSKSLYVQMLGDEAFLGDFSSVRRFERVVTRNQRVMTLLRTMKPVVTEKDIWNEYKERNALRVFDFAEVKRNTFDDAAQLAVGPADELAAFEANTERFRIQDGAQIEVVKLIPDQVPVTDEEVSARYERDKMGFYRNVAAETDGGEPVFRPLEEVRDRVVGDVRADKQTEILADALLAARQKRDAGEEYVLKELIPEELRGAVDTPAIPVLRRGERLPSEIFAIQLTQQLFSNYTQLQVGDLPSAPLTVASGSFVYRVTEKLPSRPATFEEVADDVSKFARDEKANELMAEYLDGLIARMDEDPDLDLAGVARLEGIEVHRTDPLRSIDRLNVTINDQRVAGSVQIVNQGFLIEKAGDVVRVDALDRSASYVVAYIESQEPTAEDFEGQRENIEFELEGEKRRATFEQFRDDIESRITFPAPEDEATDVE